MVDHKLARSFESAGRDYDRFRPGFPSAAADLIVPVSVPVVLDLGAGTGKFTRELLCKAERVIAVDPSEQMLDVLRANLPTVETIVGGAEYIALPDDSVNAVAVAQAFHWFARDSACAEIHRVLVPGGTLGLLWNHADPSCVWDVACHAVAHPAVSEVDGTASSAVEDLPGFEFVEKAEIAWRERITRAAYLARWLTVSSFMIAGDEDRSRMIAEIALILDTDQTTEGREEFDLPQVTSVFVYRGVDLPSVGRRRAG